jgi:hypothetical protein
MTTVKRASSRRGVSSGTTLEDPTGDYEIHRVVVTNRHGQRRTVALFQRRTPSGDVHCCAPALETLVSSNGPGRWQVNCQRHSSIDATIRNVPVSAARIRHDARVAMESSERGEVLVLSATRGKWFVSLGTSLLVAVGFFPVGGDAASLRWLVVAVCAVAGALALGQILRPATLEVDSDGITIGQLGRRWRYEFGDCSEFRVWRMPLFGNRLVVFDHPSSAGRHPRLARVNRALGSGTTALPDRYGRSPADLAALLNARRSSSAIR